MAELKSPKENVAEDRVVNVQTATTRIKKIITEYVVTGGDPTKEIAKAIKECCDNIKDDAERQMVMRSLTTSSRKWFYELTEAYRILTKNLYNSLEKNKRASYSFDIGALLTGSKSKMVDSIRPYLEGTKHNIVPIIENYRAQMQRCFKSISADPARVMTQEGNKISVTSLRNKSECMARFEANMGDLERFRNSDKDIKLVWISSHPNCSPRCAKWQGRLYSLDGTTGSINGIRYEPIENALNDNKGNGCISGYNCRHRMIPYTEGSKPPSDYTDAEIRREYAIDQRQRAYENNIRQLKVEQEIMLSAGNTEEAKRLSNKWHKQTIAYEKYSLENGRAFSRWRCVVDVNEREYLKNNTK